MKYKILGVGMSAWFFFLFVLFFTLIYGLTIRDKGENVNDVKVMKEESLSDKLSLSRVHREKFNSSEKEEDDFRGKESREVKREAVLMGSQFVFIVDAPRQQALHAITEAAAEIKRLEANLSSWKPSSDISRLNEFAGRQVVKVSPETLKLLRTAKRLSIETEGAFDVTVGAVWNLWPFRNRHLDIPDQGEIEQQLKLVNASKIKINDINGTAYLPEKGMKVNLGAIGKGFAAEVAINKMKSMGIERAAVSAGGDLYLLGKKNSGPWVVELEHPRWPGRYLDRFVAGDISVATSGDAKQFVVKNGKRYSHIIDPRSGWPVSECQSVTVITQSSIKADAYATAVYVMGPQKGISWVEAMDGVEALIVDSEGLTSQSSGWSEVTKVTALPSSGKPAGGAI